MAQAHGQEPIVVGLDSDPGRRAALDWAADEADRRQLPLLVAVAQNVPTPGYRPTGGRPSWEEWNDALHATGDRVLKEAVASVESRHPRLRVSGLLAEGHPAWVLRASAAPIRPPPSEPSGRRKDIVDLGQHARAGRRNGLVRLGTHREARAASCCLPAQPQGARARHRRRRTEIRPPDHRPRAVPPRALASARTMYAAWARRAASYSRPLSRGRVHASV
ncbi:universal stress protein [Streptomyces hygroscopicus]|uniref:universal stress protein n=1 Tax=Streptomyces hygroscopicus TaxID=1912 RepID=UPI0033F9B79F